LTLAIDNGCTCVGVRRRCNLGEGVFECGEPGREFGRLLGREPGGNGGIPIGVIPCGKFDVDGIRSNNCRDNDTGVVGFESDFRLILNGASMVNVSILFECYFVEDVYNIDINFLL
jgi:hypothetical protein